MEKLMENDGAINGQWRKIKGTWWKKWKMTENEWTMMEILMEHVRKLMEHDGTTNVTWKKLMESEGKGIEHERKWIESQKQQRKNKQQHILKKTSPYLISLFKVFQNSAVRIFFSPVANNQPLYNLLAW